MHLPFRLLAVLLTGILLLSTGCRSESAAPGETTATEPAASTTSAAPASDEAGVVLVLGNSIAAGYGLDPSQSFPALLQEKIDSVGMSYRVINAGVSGETTAGGLRRLDWLLRQEVDVLILELGGNDGLRGTNLDATRANLQAIIDQTRDRYPEVEIILAGMQIPPNLGGDYTRRFRTLYPELARANDAVLIPFLLEGVGGVPALNQSDGIHPTAAGQRIVAQNVWEVLEPVLHGVPAS